MKRKILTIFLLTLISNQFVFSQSKGIKIYIKDRCNSSTYISDGFTITNNNDQKIVYNAKDTSDLVDGKYSMTILGVGEITIDKKGNQTYIDTLYEECVKEMFILSPFQYMGYYNCDNVCNGLTIDYYKPGIKRIEGTFKNGMPIGQIKCYRFDGTTEEVRIYSIFHRRKKTIYFKSDGSIERIDRNRKTKIN